MTLPTALVLSGVGLPPYSARGLRESLTPIGASSVLRRTVNGNLRDISDPIFRKYRVAISGDDISPPAFDLVWGGKELTVDCISKLGRALTTDDSITEPGDFGKDYVPGSVTIEDGFIFYRPRLTMLVVDWSANSEEWDAATSWTLTLEEV